jgi:hypothetical protein
MIRLLKFDAHGKLIPVTFTDQKELAPYGVLSHTWLDDEESEVFLRDISNENFKTKAGYRKIQFCKEQAQEDGIVYFWVDTCCIDKTSSAEVQEAIASMFTWYTNSTCCYVYLSDVSFESDGSDPQACLDEWLPQFRKSRWFTRSWTLQELLAPPSVKFFSCQGTKLGTKNSLERYIHEITDIPYRALRGADLGGFTIAQRWMWADNRHAKRIEDQAYALLGIFGVIMPLIYGEGSHATERLQKKIRKKLKAGSELENVLSKLPVVPQAAFNSLENQHESVCLPHTRVDLLRKIQAWVDGSDPRCIFWLDGIAGTGKTTIARTVASMYHRQKRLGASFFFSRGGGDISRADRLLTTFAWQLADNVRQLRPYICEAIMEQESIGTFSIREHWEHLILGPLSRLDHGADAATIVLVLDALDECDDDSDIRIILRLLAETRSLRNTRLRIFITSRPESSVRRGFRQIPEADRQSFVLHDIAPTLVNGDLTLFFEENFAEIREKHHLPSNWPGSSAISNLVESSSGLFVWASTACRYIKEGEEFAPKRLTKVIDGQKASYGPHKQLDQIYLTVLDGFTNPNLDEDEIQERYANLRAVLGVIVTIFSTLPMDALARLLHTKTEYLFDTLAELHTIVKIPKHTNLPIRLHHPTFRDFLLDSQRCHNDNFQVAAKQAHKVLADNCVQLMSSLLRHDLCDLCSTGVVIQDIEQERIEQCIPRELQYACLYWVEHYRLSGTHLEDDDVAHRFLKEHFLHWLEAISLMRKGSEMLKAISMVRERFEVAAVLRVYQSLLQVSQIVPRCLDLLN